MTAVPSPRHRKPLTVRESILDYRVSSARRGEPANWIVLDCCPITSPELPARLAALRAELDEIERLHRQAVSPSLPSAPRRETPSRSPRPQRSSLRPPRSSAQEPSPC